jgi:2-phospho-L-lactate guanylyltransferase
MNSSGPQWRSLPAARVAGCCALIAVKRRVLCKTRLGERLEGERRVQLVRAMLARVLAAASASSQVAQVIVLSPERDLVPADVPVLADAGEGLNEALTQARSVLLRLGCSELLVLPADLPGVRPGEIDALVRMGRRGGVALAPDAGGTGTNALYLGTDQPFDFRFGAGSRALHLQEARRRGLLPGVLESAGLAFDVDLPEDLGQLEGDAWHALLQA